MLVEMTLRKPSPTCNLLKLGDKRQRHWHCWLQLEKKAGLQGLTWHLMRQQEYGTAATGHHI